MEDTLDSTSGSGSVTITEKMKSDLKGASPWMKFVGIFYIVVMALEAIAVLILLTQAFHISIVILAALVGIGIYMGTLVLKMGNNYSNFLQTLSSENLEKAFDAQKKFWMIMGIFIILSILISIVGYSYMMELQEQMR